MWLLTAVICLMFEAAVLVIDKDYRTDDVITTCSLRKMMYEIDDDGDSSAVQICTGICKKMFGFYEPNFEWNTVQLHCFNQKTYPAEAADIRAVVRRLRNGFTCHCFVTFDKEDEDWPQECKDINKEVPSSILKESEAKDYCQNICNKITLYSLKWKSDEKIVLSYCHLDGKPSPKIIPLIGFIGKTKQKKNVCRCGLPALNIPPYREMKTMNSVVMVNPSKCEVTKFQSTSKNLAHAMADYEVKFVGESSQNNKNKKIHVLPDEEDARKKVNDFISTYYEDLNTTKTRFRFKKRDSKKGKNSCSPSSSSLGKSDPGQPTEKIVSKKTTPTLADEPRKNIQIVENKKGKGKSDTVSLASAGSQGNLQGVFPESRKNHPAPTNELASVTITKSQENIPLAKILTNGKRVYKPKEKAVVSNKIVIPRGSPETSETSDFSSSKKNREYQKSQADSNSSRNKNKEKRTSSTSSSNNFSSGNFVGTKKKQHKPSLSEVELMELDLTENILDEMFPTSE